MRTNQLYATVGRHAYPVETWEQVSAAYLHAINAAGAHLSETPPCHIVDTRGRVVAYVSLSGKVFREAHGGQSVLLYNPHH